MGATAAYAQSENYRRFTLRFFTCLFDRGLGSLQLRADDLGAADTPADRYQRKTGASSPTLRDPLSVLLS
jgi:hypothetical protein